MTVTKEALAQRLKVAREASGLTQDEAARELGVSRGAIAQIEGGMRPPNGLQLARLAALYGREVGDFLASDFAESGRDALSVLFRADPRLAEDRERAAAVRECVALCREYTNLESLLELDRDRVYPVAYDVPPPRNRWEAIRQGERLATLERRRLHLGDGLIRDMGEILELQGVCAAEISLPDDISGMFLHDARQELFIVVNRDHHARRGLFSYAHEYCHVLADRDRTSLVSKAGNRADLSEVRANAFAAAFLMPEDGVRELIRSLGKGESSRSVLQAFDGAEAIGGQKRAEAGTQDIQVYDVVHVAHHFGVSYETALYRLQNLKLLSEDERRELAEQKDAANTVRSAMLAKESRQSDLPNFRPRLLMLAAEAYRREVISAGKLRGLCAMAGLDAQKIDDLVDAIEGTSSASGAAMVEA